MINNMEQGLISVSNKAVCTTASVAYRWAGAVMPFKQLFGKTFKSVTDQRIDGWMDQQSDMYVGVYMT